jgi:ribosomal protein L7/L12
MSDERLVSLAATKDFQRGPQMAGEYDTKTLQAHFAVTNRRLDRIEAQLKLIAQQSGVAYATYAESLNVADDVVALARDGKQLEAIKRYRELTGANIDQAREVIIGL